MKTKKSSAEYKTIKCNFHQEIGTFITEEAKNGWEFVAIVEKNQIGLNDSYFVLILKKYR